MTSIADDQMLPLIHGAAKTTGDSRAAAATTTQDQLQFQRLLDTLQRLQQDRREAPQVEDADQLQSAMQRAAEDFTTAMDLRRQLEAAFRGRWP